MTDIPRLEKAQLIPMTGDDADMDAAITVQFNPETLKVGLANTLQADNAGGGQSSAAQYVSKSESTLSLTLVFDTSVDSPRNQAERDAAFDAAVDEFLSTEQSFSEFEQGLRTDGAQAAERLDVRTRTRAIATLFMQPQDGDGQGSGDHPAPPRRCRFQWGAFAFVGMVASYDETLEFFSPEGLPLRATLALTLKEDRFQFEQVARPEPAVREQPRFAPGGGSVADAARNAGGDPRNWRDVAIFNGIEAPRLAASVALGAPGVSLSGSAALGGAGIAAGAVTGGGFSAGLSGPGLSADISGGGLSAGLSGGGLSMSGPSFSTTASTKAPAKAAFSVGASSVLGTDVPGAFVALGGAGATASARAAARPGTMAEAELSATTRADASGPGAVSAATSAAARASADFDFDTA